MDRNKIISILLALLLEDDDDTPVVKAAPKTAPKAKATVKTAPRSMSMNAHEEAAPKVASKVHEAFPMAEGVLEFDPIGNVHITTGLKSCLVVKDVDHLDRIHSDGNYQLQVWAYGPTNVTFPWPGFLRVFGDSSKWQSVAIDASHGRMDEIPENTRDQDFLSEYLEAEGGDNKLRLKWRRIAG